MKLWPITKGQVKMMLLFSLTYFCYYLCRYNYAIAIPIIKEEFQVSAMMVGWIATAMVASYAVGQVVNGFLADRKGPRIMMTIGGIGSAIANFAMGGNFIFDLFILIWLANGYFQAMGAPSMLKLLANWFREGERGKPFGFCEMLQSLAAISILPLGAFLIMTVSWRMVFIVPAVLLGIVTLVFYAKAENNPPGTEQETKKPILKDIAYSYHKALGNWRLVVAYIGYGCSQFLRYAMITWIPAYLYLETGMSIFRAALTAMAFQIGGAIGSPIIGWVSDIFHTRRWLLLATGMVISGVAGAAVGWVPPTFAVAIIAVLIVCGAGIEALEIPFFLIPIDYLGKSLAGTGVGCMNATGKAIASLQGVLLGWIIDTFGYGSAFGVAGAFGLLAAILIAPLGFGKWK